MDSKEKEKLRLNLKDIQSDKMFLQDYKVPVPQEPCSLKVNMILLKTCYLCNYTKSDEDLLLCSEDKYICKECLCLTDMIKEKLSPEIIYKDIYSALEINVLKEHINDSLRAEQGLWEKIKLWIKAVDIPYLCSKMNEHLRIYNEKYVDAFKLCILGIIRCIQCDQINTDISQCIKTITKYIKNTPYDKQDVEFLKSTILCKIIFEGKIGRDIFNDQEKKSKSYQWYVPMIKELIEALFITNENIKVLRDGPSPIPAWIHEELHKKKKWWQIL